MLMNKNKNILVSRLDNVYLFRMKKMINKWKIVIIFNSILLLFCFILFGCASEKKENLNQRNETYFSKELDISEKIQINAMDLNEKKLYIAGRVSNQENSIIVLDSNGNEEIKMKWKNIKGNIQCISKRENDNYFILTKTEDIQENSVDNNYNIMEIDKDGTIINSVKLNDDGKCGGDSFVLYTSQFNKDGEIYAATSGKLLWFGNDGMLIKWIKTDIERIDSILCIDDRIFITGGGNGKKLIIYEYNKDILKQCKDGERVKTIKHETKASSSYQVELIPCIDSSCDFYINDGVSVYQYFIETESLKELYTWIESGLKGSNIYKTISLSESCFFTVLYDNENSKLFRISLGEKNTKEKIVLATIKGIDNDMILDFNNQNDKIEIVIKDYSKAEEPIQEIQNDMIHGENFDILDLNGLNIKDYANKGFLEDLTEYLKEDLDISEEDFISSILKVCKIEEKLYFIPSSFHLWFLIGNQKTIQGRKTWHIEDFIKLQKDLTKKEELIWYMDSESILRRLCRSNLEQFVNFDSGKVDFSNHLFTKILQCAKGIKEKNYEDGFQIMEAMQKGNIVLAQIPMFDYKDFAFYKKIYKESEVIGWPSKDNSGISIEISGQLAIVSNSKKKKEAFEFLKTFWLYEYQKEIYSGFPTRKDALDIKLEHNMASKSYTDKDGDLVNPIGGTINQNGVEVSYGPMTKEDEEIIRELINNIAWIDFEVSFEEDIISIIVEEAKSYFIGDKTAKEIEDIIENRIKIYINENN